MRLSCTVPVYDNGGQHWNAFTEPCESNIALAKLVDDEAEIEATIKTEVQRAIDEINANPDTTNITLSEEDINEIAAKTAAGVTTTIDVPTAKENAEATADELHDRTAA
jgi:pimeloyl-CoA synthetase